MSCLGVDRKSRSSRYQVDPTDELTAFCDEELPRLDQRIGPKPEPPTPNSENLAHEKAPFRHFQTSALPVAPPARDGLSSLSYVSFLDREIYFSHLRQGLISEGYRSIYTQRRARAHPGAQASVPFVLRRFTKSSVGGEIAMSSDRERSVVMRC